MAKDRTNMTPESISVKRTTGRPVSMSLPRGDDGDVHMAVGMPANTSAVHYANAMSRVFAGGAAKPFQQTSGGQ